MAERIRGMIEDFTLLYEGSLIRITVSIGVSALKEVSRKLLLVT